MRKVSYVISLLAGIAVLGGCATSSPGASAAAGDRPAATTAVPSSGTAPATSFADAYNAIEDQFPDQYAGALIGRDGSMSIGFRAEEPKTAVSILAKVPGHVDVRENLGFSLREQNSLMDAISARLAKVLTKQLVDMGPRALESTIDIAVSPDAMTDQTARRAWNSLGKTAAVNPAIAIVSGLRAGSHEELLAKVVAAELSNLQIPPGTRLSISIRPVSVTVAGTAEDE